ncbi:MAG: DNA mismatch repair protein MutS [Candidatus Woesearchaeota archaeon]
MDNPSQEPKQPQSFFLPVSSSQVGPLDALKKQAMKSQMKDKSNIQDQQNLPSLTPAMHQYMYFKTKYPHCLLFFRMGDFYETFYDDAKIVSAELDIVLTSRGKDEKKAPLAGIPYHALDQYLGKLIKKGYAVALVDQVEDPKKAKGLVKRDLVRIVTPGTLFEDRFLSEEKTNYLAALAAIDGLFSLAAADISTGSFFVMDCKNEEDCLTQIKQIMPSEILYPSSFEMHQATQTLLQALQGFLLRQRPAHEFSLPFAQQILQEQFGRHALPSLHLTTSQSLAAGGILGYIKETQRKMLSHLITISIKNQDVIMPLDEATIRNLELVQHILTKEKKGSLLGVLDHTKTPMGARLLREWICQPLTSLPLLMQRLNTVEFFVEHQAIRDELRSLLTRVKDIERLSSRITYGSATPKDLLVLADSLGLLPFVQQHLQPLSEIPNTLYHNLVIPEKDLNALTQIHQQITQAIDPQAPAHLREGNIFLEGYSLSLDELRHLRSNARHILLSLEEREKEATGIKTLKIGYNRVFGYYLEISKKYVNQVPSHYLRKQTQANAERYVTQELKELEEKILHAEEQALQLEKTLYGTLLQDIAAHTKALQGAAKAIALLDVLLSLSHVAHHHHYTKPYLHEGYDFIVKDGRHPVLEQLVDVFVANDCKLTEQERMMIITGPNMAGKSTYMRQIALIALLAHLGSYVPASFAKIGILDRIFTRVGAYDDLAHGQSTFMVEMTEVAFILHHATNRSLIILDEIGRGTSTFDGIALAWSTAEYIATTIKAKTLFATHYHLLNDLEREHQGIVNFNIAVAEDEHQIYFLRKIVHGGTDKSYGIHVAALAGVPLPVIERAKAVQLKLEADDKEKRKLVIEQPSVFAHRDPQQNDPHKKHAFVPTSKHVQLRKQKDLLDY